ncbi:MULTISPECIES: GNAT family N-acetyltransferase [Streptomyces]|uniref:Histone acetyltransferase HPA2 and related acetyltransferases n=1 Tax=Streptomyces venezuelae (strain ATCC 10712 / CBS 650.69 / DSM 40230 / JCM 4526 / NBRC 13096 / PD 04745) TaxID=953739 RepID=F2RD84_STRVP|nr:GNAT family N-acetyltransferase [Streptomyces venezuelae]APE22749.1 GNAT family N-acetyltransferase [Streptomyces venezuelae]CCA56980.1 Histone acetyltransferase HPA2 and related acetyltransferases [Streptomyces venezuelae ATCC 10712]
MPISPSLAQLPVRRLTSDDLLACADLSENRGWPREEHKWGLLLTAGTGYGIDDPSGAGLLACSVVTSYGPGLAAIGMVLVAERYARQGVGRRLMEHVVTEAGDTPLTLHATPNGQPLYEQLGFTETSRAEMVRGRFTFSTPAPAVPVRPATAEDLQTILRLDHEVFGLDRTHMITRLPAFADHLRVAVEDGEVTGFAAAWPNMDTHVVGPLIARDPATAQALIASLAAAGDRPLRTDVDVRHTALLGWLKENGVDSVASNAVMVRSLPDLPGDWRRRFAPLTVAAG